MKQACARAWSDRAFSYNDLKKAGVIAADAGRMQIEWSGGVACRRAGVARRSTAADTMGRKVGYVERMLWRECLKLSGKALRLRVPPHPQFALQPQLPCLRFQPAKGSQIAAHPGESEDGELR
jgi:hypothetical protein